MATTVASRYIVPLGPVKMEVLNLTGVTDADTVTSQLQNPKFAMAVINTDNGAATAPTNVSISGRTLTLNSADISSSEINVLVFGF